METTEVKEKKIYKALARIMQVIPAIGKNGVNQQQRFAYRSIEDVMNVLKPIFAKNGVVLLPEVVEESVTNVAPQQQKPAFQADVTVNYHFIADDGSRCTATMCGSAMDYGDKAVAKAMTMAMKSLLTQVFMIPTKDMVDPDSQTYGFDPNSPEGRLRQARNREEAKIIWERVKADYPTQAYDGSDLHKLANKIYQELPQ